MSRVSVDFVLLMQERLENVEMLLTVLIYLNHPT